MTTILNRSTDFTTEELQAAVAGHSDQLQPGPALTLLTGRRYAGAGTMLERLSQDRGRTDVFRAHAVRLLVTLNFMGLEPFLLRMLNDPAPAVAREAARALGRLGVMAALEPLQRAARYDGRQGHEAGVASLILAARLGIPGPSFQDWASSADFLNPADCGESAGVRKARRADINAALAVLADDPLDIVPDASSSLLIEGQGFEWLMLLNRGFVALLDELNAPALLAVLMEWDPSDDEWVEGFLLIADASAKHTQRPIALIDAAGDIVMKGVMPRSEEGWSFTLTTSVSTMLHARIDGTIAGEIFDISRMHYRSEVTGRQKAAVLDSLSARV
ncbi:MAG: HEAT repeat domain-containing protein [Phormidesmis sp.]